MPIQLIDISSSHSTLLFFLAWQKNVFPPLLPIVPTPCGTFYKGPTRPLLSIGKSIIKDSVNMNVARIHILFKNQWSWSFVFEAGTQNRNYPQRAIFQTFWKPDCCTKSLFFELKTSNFGYLLNFAKPCKVSARLDNTDIRHFIIEFLVD